MPNRWLPLLFTLLPAGCAGQAVHTQRSNRISTATNWGSRRLWFHANGEAAVMVPLTAWWRGYAPENHCGAGQVKPRKLLQAEVSLLASCCCAFGESPKLPISAVSCSTLPLQPR